jgi:hypothetical protein
MDFDRLIRNWHIKASEEDFFSKFVFEYLAFIAFLRKEKFKYCSNDRDAIQLLKQDNETKAAYLAQIQSNKKLRSAWEQIKKTFDAKPFHDAARVAIGKNEYSWWNCRYDNPDQKTSQENAKASGVIHSLEDWENMVEFWHSVRNNLFHGAKDPERERDRFAVEYGYKTLIELVELFLSSETQRTV